MITIGKIPKKLQGFFKPVKKQVSEHVYGYFWSMVLSMCISHGSTIEQTRKVVAKQYSSHQSRRIPLAKHLG